MITITLTLFWKREKNIQRPRTDHNPATPHFLAMQKQSCWLSVFNLKSLREKLYDYRYGIISKLSFYSSLMQEETTLKKPNCFCFMQRSRRAARSWETLPAWAKAGIIQLYGNRQ
jgi:hypothetical protein